MVPPRLPLFRQPLSACCHARGWAPAEAATATSPTLQLQAGLCRTCPSFSTMIWSASMMVLSRCATMTTVRSLRASARDACSGCGGWRAASAWRAGRCGRREGNGRDTLLSSGTVCCHRRGRVKLSQAPHLDALLSDAVQRRSRLVLRPWRAGDRASNEGRAAGAHHGSEAPGSGGGAGGRRALQPDAGKHTQTRAAWLLAGWLGANTCTPTRMRMGGFFRMARANATRCFSPPLQAGAEAGGAPG